MKFEPKATVFLLLLWCFQCPGQETRVIDRSLAQLRDFNEEIRIAGLRNLQTSLDPRIPEACLPLLRDDGNSIRRLAARAIGSRYHQIRKVRIPEYVEALRVNLANREKFPDEGRMAARAIGLLTRDYKGEMFSPSPDGRWVIYERYHLPCLIDVKRQNEELMGWNPEFSPWFGPAWSNSAVADSALWHKESEAVALDIIEGRKYSLVWIWMPKGSELIQLDLKRISEALSIGPDSIYGPGGFYVSLKQWKEADFIFEVSYTIQDRADPEKFEDSTVTMAWNLESKELRKLKGPGSRR